MTATASEVSAVVTLDAILTTAVAAALTGTALAAYNLAGIPIPWLAQAGVIAIGALWLLIVRRVPAGQSVLVLACFLLWSLFVNALNASEFSGQMPALATLPYDAFVLMRYLTFVAFLAAFLLTCWLTRRGHAPRLLKAIVWVGIVIGLCAVYIHAAQYFGWPEPTRNRLGTGGGAQAVAFSSGTLAYRRALGTFREPSHLAEWLLLPLFASIGLGGRLGRVGTIVSGAVLLLTVSLTGILSAAAGFIGALLLLNPLNRRNRRMAFRAAFVLALAVWALSVIPIGTPGESLTVTEVVRQRTQELFVAGFEGSSRAVWLQLLNRDGVPVVGYGFGNANIIASQRLGSDLVVSYLSLYANVLYSSGLVGLVLLGLFLVRPLLKRGYVSRTGSRQGRAFLMAYIAFLVAFVGASEELSVQFGIAAGFLEYYRRTPPSVIPVPALRVPPTASSSASVSRAELLHE